MKYSEIVKAFIEKGNDGTYGVYVDLNDCTLNYGIHGDGNTPEQAIEDFKAGYIEMKEVYKEEGINFVEAEFDFLYDDKTNVTKIKNTEKVNFDSTIKIPKFESILEENEVVV